VARPAVEPPAHCRQMGPPRDHHEISALRVISAHRPTVATEDDPKELYDRDSRSQGALLVRMRTRGLFYFYDVARHYYPLT
jgi:hypothetical protein